MHLANSQYLLLSLFIPIYLWLVYYKKKNKKAINISVFSDLKKASQKSKFHYLAFAKHVLVVVLIILWSLCLARPQGAHEKQEISKKGIDVIVAIDVSESMLAEDLKPNRIEAAKASLNQFVSKLEDDRLGIIVFAGQAFTQSPLTFDYSILTEYIDRISTDSINKGVRGLSGTAIGDAMLSAVNRFKESNDRSKVLVLITDGDANTGADPEIAAQKIREEGINFYAVGVGREGGAPIKVTDAFGRKKYAKNHDGTIYMATFNEESLKNVAKVANGRYFRVSDNQSFNEVMEEVNNLEKRDIKVERTTEYTENFMPFLFLLSIIFLGYLYLLSFKTEIK